MFEKSVVNKSMFWSLFGEVASKFIVPITTMILARILVPEDFGVIAICNMVVSFADIITDAGFGKYLVQHDFANEEEKYKNADVAFWSNFVLSCLSVIIIFFAKKNIAQGLGDEKYASAIFVSSIQLLFTAFSSIQIGLFRRSFDYKKLFIARLAVALLPLLTAIPIALLTKSYWALIIGNLMGALGNAIILSVLSPWSPRLFYSFRIFKEMFSYSFWSLCEGMAHWVIFWVDTFIIAMFFSEYYVGIYKNSANIVMSLFGVVSASMSPVLLSSLSRLKNEKNDFFDLFLLLQRLLAYVVLPMGLGLYFFRHLATLIVFGEQWMEAADVIGWWGIMMMISVVFYTFVAELYKSKGIPQKLFLFQVLYLVFMIPMCFLAAKHGFWILVYTRCACVIEQVVVCMILLKIVFDFNPIIMLRNVLKPFVATIPIIICGLFSILSDNNTIHQVVLVCLSVLLYVFFVFLFYRNDIVHIFSRVQKYKL